MGTFDKESGSRGSRRGGYDHNKKFRSRRDFSRNKQMFRVVCSNCGKDCDVPFKPTGDKPVYCSACFEKMGGRDNRKSFDGTRFRERQGQTDQYKTQFEAINTKLDNIINILQPRPDQKITPPVDADTETQIEETETKTPKVKKLSK